MSIELSPDRQRRLREVAILVTSLDEHLAKRLVESMPSADAAAVRLALKQLGAIDPDERDEIVAKFRQSSEVQRPTKVDGVELDASLLARFEEPASPDADSETIAAGKTFSALSEEELTTVVQMLSDEHPQTISVVLTRLSPANAANLLSKFPPSIQADVLARMADCDTADEQAVQVIESQLGQWIDQHRQQRQRMAAGLDLVQRILSNSSETQRATVLTQLKGRNPDLAERLRGKTNPLMAPAANAYRDTIRADIEEVGAVARASQPREIEPQQFVSADRQVALPRSVSPREQSARPSEELDELDDATLMATLSQTDRQIVTLALAGASEALMERVLRGLPRRRAGKLRSQLRDIGPTRLSDILAAQRHFLHSAHQLKPKC